MIKNILNLKNAKILSKKDQSHLYGGHNGLTGAACRRHCISEFRGCENDCPSTDISCKPLCNFQFKCCLDTCVPNGGQIN